MMASASSVFMMTLLRVAQHTSSRDRPRICPCPCRSRAESIARDRGDHARCSGSPVRPETARIPGETSEMGRERDRALHGLRRPDFRWLAVPLLADCAHTQGVKTWYIRRFHAWL